MSEHARPVRALPDNPLAPAGDDSPRVWRRTLVLLWPTLWGASSGSIVRQSFRHGGALGWIGALATVVSTVALVIVVTLLFDDLQPRGGLVPDRIRRLAWRLFWLGLALSVVVLVLDGPPALALLGFAAAAVGLGLPWRHSVPIIVTGVALVYVVFGLTPAGNGHAPTGACLGLLGAGLGSALGRFSAERDRAAKVMASHAHQLEIAEERNRMARDLHDILGHSLTVIAMKTELAEMLLDADPERARGELREVQSLTRSALADVRATVNNYRELSLAGEIARAGVTLRTAGVRADLPATVDEVDPACRELFAWALREGVTNIVRHAGARTCVVTLTPTSLRIDDDGLGRTAASGDGTGGNGLTGLRQRAQAVGAVVETPSSRLAGDGRPGFCLFVYRDAA